MSTIIMSKCWPLSMPATAKSVLISLADNANDHGHCWPAIPTICERTCYKRDAVINAIKHLEQIGLLIANRSNGRHTTYQINVDEYLQNQSAKTTSGLKPPVVQNVKAVGLNVQPVGLNVKAVGQTDSNHKNHQEPSGTVNKKNPDDFVLPDWIDSDLWADFVAMRKQIKKPMSAAAAKLLISKLSGFRDRGFDIAELIGNSIIGGWPSVYEPKASNKPSGTAAFDPVAYINQNRTSKQGGQHDSIDGHFQRVD